MSREGKQQVAATEVAEADSPHVLYVADRDHVARLGRMLCQLGLALGEAGARVTWLSDDPGLLNAFQETPVRAIHTRSFWGWDRWRLPALLRGSLRTPPHVIHLWGLTALGVLRRLARQHGVPLLVHLASVRDAERFVRRGLRPRERLLCSTRRQAALLGEPLRARAADAGLFPPALLAPEHNDEFDPRGRTLGIVWTGRYAGRSGLNVLLDAVARLHEARVDLVLGLIGRGPGTREVWQQLRRRNLQSCTTLADVPALWDRTVPGADICVVPAREDEVTLAPLLAMACGRIVLASSDQTADWYIDGQTCLMFPPGDADELVRLIRRARDAHPQVRALSRSAAEYVRRHHAVTDLADRLLAVYRRCIAERKRPAVAEATT